MTKICRNLSFRLTLYEPTVQCCLFSISGLTFGLLGKGEPILINSIPGATDEGQCERLEEEVARADRDTVVEEPPRLNGKWVSEG